MLPKPVHEDASEPRFKALRRSQLSLGSQSIFGEGLQPTASKAGGARKRFISLDWRKWGFGSQSHRSKHRSDPTVRRSVTATYGPSAASNQPRRIVTRGDHAAMRSSAASPPRGDAIPGLVDHTIWRAFIATVLICARTLCMPWMRIVDELRQAGAILRRILVAAVEWGHLDAVPPLPRIKVLDASFDFFAKDEAAQLVQAARNQEERLLLMFALQTGARAGEQLALEWGDLDWRNNFVVFRRSSTRGVVDHTKSGRERRVPLTQSLTRGAEGAPAHAQQACVLQRRRPSAVALAVARAAPDGLSVSGAQEGAVARSEALVRVAARDRGRTAQASAGVARPLHDPHDDALLAPRAERRCRADRSPRHRHARSAWQRRGNGEVVSGEMEAKSLGTLSDSKAAAGVPSGI